MEETKTRNGPLDVIKIEGIEEREYRKLNALSYSRLSDIQEIGEPAVNAIAKDINLLRPIVIGKIVDDVISNRRPGIPFGIQVVNKMPNPESITFTIANYIGDFLSKKYGNVGFKHLTEQDVIALCLGKGFFKNGVTEKNVFKKMTNYAEYINKVKVHDPSYIITSFEKLIIESAIKKLRKIEMFDVGYARNGNVSTVAGLGGTIKTITPKSHIEYQSMFLATVLDVEFKCMVDALHFDHINKTIRPIDIKTGVLLSCIKEDFKNECYFFYNYYIQAGIYRKILVEYFKYHPKYKEYKVENFTFIYACTHPKKHLSIHDCFFFEMNEDEYLESFRGTVIVGESGKTIVKNGIVSLINLYKTHKINPLPREALLKEIESYADANLPF